jgi:hypothetical protein
MQEHSQRDILMRSFYVLVPSGMRYQYSSACWHNKGLVVMLNAEM